jgi:hypothetical protein
MHKVAVKLGNSMKTAEINMVILTNYVLGQVWTLPYLCQNAAQPDIFLSAASPT